MTVSVIVPTFQRRALVVDAVASVLAQWHRDLELIVVDDGSTDGTGAALAAFGPRIRVLSQENRGAAAARNAGLATARGALVAFLDSDNRWLPEHLAVVAGALERHPTAVLAYAQRTRGRRPIQPRGRVEAEAPLPRMLVGNAVGCLSAVVARREAVLAVGGFDERLHVTEDADLWLRLALTGRSFVRVPRQTVVRGAGGGSLFAGRRRGEYTAALELSTRSALRAAPGDDGLTGRLHLIAALQALERGDRRGLDAELEAAARLLPLVRSRPASLVNHARFTLTAEDGPAVVARRLVTLHRSLRRLGFDADPRAFCRGALMALRGPDRPQPAVRVQRWMLRTERGPLRPIWALSHEALARAAAAYLRRGDPSTTAYVRGSLGAGEPVYGLSDVDLSFVAGGDAVMRRWRRLPGVARALVDAPQVYTDEDLAELIATTPLTYDTATPGLRPSCRERSRERAGAERLRLYGAAADWRLLTGPERRPPPAVLDADARRIVAWLELQFWWLQAFRACAEPHAAWAPHVCAKLMTEPARIWMWLAHGERIDGRRALIRRALDALPEEREPLLAARALLDALDGPAPLPGALQALTRMSGRIASRIDEEVASAGTTEVALVGATSAVGVADAVAARAARSVVDGARGRAAPPAGPAPPAGAAPPALLPLADWRALVWSLPPDEGLVPVSATWPDAALLGHAALVCNEGVYVGVRLDDLLVLPTLKRSRLRAVQCAATDPVSFALMEGRASAAFPDVPGWSARDTARRAAAEHLGWLAEGCAGPDRDRRLAGAARAALFLESVERGEPELLLTVAAVEERLGPLDAGRVGGLPVYEKGVRT